MISLLVLLRDALEPEGFRVALSIDGITVMKDCTDRMSVFIHDITAEYADSRTIGEVADLVREYYKRANR